MGGCKAPITTFIVEPFMPHDQEFYLSIVSERLGSTISFSECGGIEIEENWDKVIHLCLLNLLSLSVGCVFCSAFGANACVYVLLMLHRSRLFFFQQRSL